MSVFDINDVKIDNSDVDLSKLEGLRPVTEKYKIKRHTKHWALPMMAISVCTAIWLIPVMFPGIPNMMAAALTIFATFPTGGFMLWTSQLYFYKDSNTVLQLFSCLCQDNERLITYSIGKPCDTSTSSARRWYYFFSTRRIFVVSFTSEVNNTSKIEDAVLDGSILDKIGNITVAGYSKNCTAYGGFFMPIELSIAHTQLLLTTHDDRREIQHLLLHKFSRNGKLIREIFRAVQPKH